MSATKPKTRLSSILLNGAVLLSALTAIAPAQAQVPAALPSVESVAPGEATDADGTYVVSTINKRITIENGRAYVIDPWNTALIFTVKSGMVTLQNFRQTGPNTYEADDLPMMGKVVFNRQPNGTLQGVVQGALGEAKYALVPTEYASLPNDGLPGGGAPGGGDPGGDPGLGAPPPPSNDPWVYRLHVSGGECSGSKFGRVKYNGQVRVTIMDRENDKRESKDRNFRVECTKNGDRTQTYKFYENGPGALTLVTPPGDVAFSDLRLGGKANGGIGGLYFGNDKNDVLSKARDRGRNVQVGDRFTDKVTVLGDKAKLNFTVTLERVK